MNNYTLNQLNTLAAEYTTLLHEDYPFSYEHSVRYYATAFVAGFVKYLESRTQEDPVDLPLECYDENPWSTLTINPSPALSRGHDDTSGS